jgi:hypothetical protein
VTDHGSGGPWSVRYPRKIRPEQKDWMPRSYVTYKRGCLYTTVLQASGSGGPGLVGPSPGGRARPGRSCRVGPVVHHAGSSLCPADSAVESEVGCLLSVDCLEVLSCDVRLGCVGVSLRRSESGGELESAQDKNFIVRGCWDARMARYGIFFSGRCQVNCF